MLYPQELLFHLELGTLGRGTFTVRDTLRFQLGLIRPPLLLLADLVRCPFLSCLRS